MRNCGVGFVVSVFQNYRFGDAVALDGLLPELVAFFAIGGLDEMPKRRRHHHPGKASKFICPLRPSKLAFEKGLRRE